VGQNSRVLHALALLAFIAPQDTAQPDADLRPDLQTSTVPS
jgi:hypothetical protein